MRRMKWQIAAVLGALVSALPAAAQEVSFAGKKVEMYIGSSPGGGTDLSSRLVGDFLVKYLPGEPTIVYRNIPGAQGLKALNHFATRVAPDGLSFSGGSQGHFDPAGRAGAVVEFDPLTFHYIGGITRGGTLLAIRKEAAARLSDPKARSVVMPAVTGGSTGPQLVLWGKEYLGWNVKLVIGYSGTPAMVLAALNGEADAMASSSSLQLKPLLDNPDFVTLAQLGDLDDSGKFVARTSYPHVPVFADMVSAKVPAEHRDTFLAWLQIQYIDKWFALPPGTPEPYVRAYREAFRKAAADPEFIKAARQQFGEDFQTTTANATTQLVHGMVKNGEKVNGHMRELRQKHGIPGE